MKLTLRKTLSVDDKMVTKEIVLEGSDAEAVLVPEGTTKALCEVLQKGEWHTVAEPKERQ